jgi:trans-aconitate methyltransferase
MIRRGAQSQIDAAAQYERLTDRHQALLEMRRVLAAGGWLAVAVWDSLDRTPAYALLVEVLERLEHRAADALRVPFRLGNRDELAALFASAGLSDTAIDTRVGATQFASVGSMVEAELEGWLPVAGIELSDDQRSRVLAEAEHVLSRFVASDGAIRFESPAHIVTATTR